MAFVRVTDPELAQILRDNGLLYEQAFDEETPTPIEWGWTAFKHPMPSSWKFYMRRED